MRAAARRSTLPRDMTRPLACLLVLLAAPSLAQECVPPAFYTGLPRDKDFYYGVARDPDTDKAREQALRNLGKQVTGDIEAWDDADVAKLAGPGQDRWKVAAEAGRLLPSSTLLAGWEQDDHERCGGKSYVLVRVEKERVARFLKGNQGFKDALLKKLESRVAKVEGAVAAIEERLSKLERGLRCLKPANAQAADAAALSRTVAAARADLAKGKSADAALKVATAEDSFAALRGRVAEYQKAHDESEKKRRAALRAEKAPELAAFSKAIASGNWGPAEAFGPIMTLRDLGEHDEIRRHVRRVLARKDKAKLGPMEDQLAYQVIAADAALDDGDGLMKDGEDFLKRYPGSDLFAAVKSMMDGRMLLANRPPAPDCD